MEMAPRDLAGAIRDKQSRLLLVDVTQLSPVTIPAANPMHLPRERPQLKQQEVASILARD
jgi:hypothetical protein